MCRQLLLGSQADPGSYQAEALAPANGTGMEHKVDGERAC